EFVFGGERNGEERWVGSFFDPVAQTVSPIGSRYHSTTEAIESFTQNVPNIGVVICDKNGPTKSFHNSTFVPNRYPTLALPGGGTGEGHNNAERCGAEDGSVNENVLPRPGSESTQIFPPCSSTRALAIARPRPVLLNFPPFTSAIWKNLKKFFFFPSAPPPGPLSNTHP